MGYSKDSKERILAEGNVIAVLEFRDKIFRGRAWSPKFYQNSFLGVYTLLSGNEHQNL